MCIRDRAKAVAYLGAAFVASAFLGLGLSFAVHSFYDFYRTAPTRLWGLSATKDQNLGGVLMSVEQTLVLAAALGFFLLRLLPDRAARPATGNVAVDTASRHDVWVDPTLGDGEPENGS